MSKPRAWMAGGAVVVALLLMVGGLLAMPAVEDALFKRVVEQHLRTGDHALFQDDALKVLLCGTSAPVPDDSIAG